MIIKEISMEANLSQVLVNHQCFNYIVCSASLQPIVGKVQFNQAFVETKSVGQLRNELKWQITVFQTESSQIKLVMGHCSAEVVHCWLVHGTVAHVQRKRSWRLLWCKQTNQLIRLRPLLSCCPCLCLFICSCGRLYFNFRLVWILHNVFFASCQSHMN